MFTPFEVVLAALVTVSPIQEVSPPMAPGGDLLAANQFRKEPLQRDPGDFGGDAQNLPVGCAHDPERLVYWARHHMPEVQRAIEEFERRGYVAVPAADTAISGCQRGVPASGVMLAFTKPGAFIDSAHVVAPAIVVLTRIHLTTGEVATQVSGGIVVVDGAASKVFSGDSLSMFRYSDPSFDIRAAGSGGGGGPRREPLERESLNGLWDPIVSPDSRFNRFLQCTGWNTVACVTGALVMGGINFTPFKLAVIMGAPEIGLALIEGCLLMGAIGCLTYLF